MDQKSTFTSDEEAFSSAPPSVSSSAKNGKRRRSARWFVLGAAALVFGPISYREAPREMARWHIAIGTEHWLDGDYQAAIVEAHEAMEWAPDYVVPYDRLAKWEIDNENYEASAAAAEKIIALAPRQTIGYQMRTQAMWGQGRFLDSLDDLKRVVELVESQETIPHRQRALALNSLAYARSLADREIDAGITDANKAIQATSANAAILDTRGFLYYRAGKFERAIRDLNRAVREAEATVKRSAYETRRRQAQSLLDPRQLKLEQKWLKKNLAVMRYHRSLVLAKIGAMREAAADRLRVRELGYQPSKHLY